MELLETCSLLTHSVSLKCTLNLIRFGHVKLVPSRLRLVSRNVVLQTVQSFVMWFCKQFKVSVRQAAELNNMSICGELAVVPKLRLRCLLVACV